MSGHHHQKAISVVLSILITSAFCPIPAALGYDEPAAEQTSDIAMTVQEAEEATGIDADAEGTAYASGEVIVVYKAGTTQKSAAVSVQSADAVETSSINDDTLLATSVENGELVPDAGGNPIAVVDVSDGQTVAQAVAELEQDPNVEYAQPNYIYTLVDGEDTSSVDADSTGESAAQDSGLTTQTTTITDPYAYKNLTYPTNPAYYQWQLSNYTSESSTLTYDLGVNCFDAWDYAKCEGSVAVAVIDTGCLVTHEDLKDNIVGAYNSVYAAKHTDRTTATSVNDVTDYAGHGTHVCGIIGAETNNGIGCSGVSYNAKIVPIKASCDTYTDPDHPENVYENVFLDDDLVQAYTYLLSDAASDFDGDGTIETVAKEYNVKVINMSLGSPDSDEYEDTSTWKDDALMKKIDDAYANGILTVCAAGNENDVMPYTNHPSDYPTCLSVIALDSVLDTATNTYTAARDRSYSNYNFAGHQVKNISAPGSYILSTVIDDSTHANNNYEAWSGTSMASPVVSGVAALMFAANSDLTPDDCKAAIYDTARDLVYTTDSGENGQDIAGTGWDVYTGYGEIDAAAAVAKAKGLLIEPAQCTVSGSFTYDGKVHTPTVTVTSAAGTTLTLGTDYTVSYTDSTGAATTTPTNAGTYNVIITGVGGGGYYGTVTKTFEIDPAPLTDAVVTANSGTYTGSAVTPGVASVILNGKTLSEGSDYGVSSYENNIDVGTATVTVTGQGNYSATASGTFAISPADVSSAYVTGVSSSYTYTGGAILPTPIVKWGTSMLTQGTDYTVSYASSDGTAVTSPTTVGTYKVVVTGEGNFTKSASANFNITLAMSRLAGGSRYATMANIVQAGFADGLCATAIVATGGNFPDALAASGLAGLYDAPVILVDGSGSLSGTYAKSELERLGVTDVVVCGGTSAVSSSLYAELQTEYGASHVSRVAGASRVDTALQILEAGKTVGTGWGDTVIVATSKNYADALSISPFSYATSSPIVLTDASGSLTDAAKQAIANGGFAHAVVVGGSSAVSADTQSWLVGEYGKTNVVRLSGAGRYSTSVDIANFSCGLGDYADYPSDFGYTALTYSRCAVATGQNFPDALAGASLCGKDNSVLLLVDDASKTGDTECGVGIEQLVDHKASIDQAFVFGGTSAISQSLYETIASQIV